MIYPSVTTASAESLRIKSPSLPGTLGTPTYLTQHSVILPCLQATADQPRFLDSIQAAEHLGGINSRTITRWAREGYLPAYPIGEGRRRLWRFLRTDLDQWMQARRTGTLAAATDAPTQENNHGW